MHKDKSVRMPKSIKCDNYDAAIVERAKTFFDYSLPSNKFTLFPVLSCPPPRPQEKP